MKIIKLSNLCNGTAPEIEIISDSAIQRTGKPFFIPDFAGKFSYTPVLAVHICRLGKNIAAKFANRYYDEIGLSLSFVAVDLLEQLKKECKPLSLATSFDSAVISGDLFSKGDLGEVADVCLQVDGVEIFNKVLLSVYDMIDDAVEYVSRYFTLKIGDCLLFDFNAGEYEPAIGSHITAFINGNKSVAIKVK